MFRQFYKSLLIVLALSAVLPVAALAATLEITGPPGASLVINDQDMGFFPLDGPLDLPAGIYNIKSKLRGHAGKQPGKIATQPVMNDCVTVNH